MQASFSRINCYCVPDKVWGIRDRALNVLLKQWTEETRGIRLCLCVWGCVCERERERSVPGTVLVPHQIFSLIVHGPVIAILAGELLMTCRRDEEGLRLGALKETHTHTHKNAHIHTTHTHTRIHTCTYSGKPPA